MDSGLTPEQRKRKIEELRASLRRGCAGPEKFARRRLITWKRELTRLLKEDG